MNSRLPSPIADVYWRLQADHESSHVEIRRELGIDRETYDAAIDDLIDLGAVAPAPARPTGITVRPLQTVLDNLVGTVDESAEKHRNLMRLYYRLVTLALSEQRSNWDDAQPLDAEIISDPFSANVVLEEILNSVNTEVLTIQSDMSIADLLVRGRAVMRIICESAVTKMPSGAAPLKMLNSAAAEIRITPIIPFRLVIVDNAIVYVCVAGSGERELSLLARDGVLIRILRRVFDYCWLHAVPLRDSVGPTGEDAAAARQPTDQQRWILRMLYDGMTDETMARELGVSVRTVRRQVAELMATMGTRSRFQAGAVAQQLDWLT